jgi:hypothetical protein
MDKLSEITGKGRAILARPLLCLLPVSLAAMLFAASAVRAAVPPAPKLTGTTPSSSESSPASSTEPLLFGEAEPDEEAITQVMTTRGFARRAFSASVTKNPGYEIEIYAEDPTCAGTPVAHGLASELEEPGIGVKVLSNSITTFYASQIDLTDPASPSKCSAGKTYWEGAATLTPPSGEEISGGSPPAGGVPSIPPAVGSANAPDAPHLRTVPGGRANDDVPLVTGSAPGAATVKLFDNPNCTGSPVIKGSAAEFASGFQVQVADNTATSFSAISVAGGQSPCAAPISYIEDSTAPRTLITMGPGVKTRRHKAVFRFTDNTDDPPGTTFLCKIDRGKWRQCSSPLRLRHLRFTRYVVRVRATDIAGNVETKGAKRLFRVVKNP